MAQFDVSNVHLVCPLPPVHATGVWVSFNCSPAVKCAPAPVITSLGQPSKTCSFATLSHSGSLNHLRVFQ